MQLLRVADTGWYDWNDAPKPELEMFFRKVRDDIRDYLNSDHRDPSLIHRIEKWEPCEGTRFARPETKNARKGVSNIRLYNSDMKVFFNALTHGLQQRTRVVVQADSLDTWTLFQLEWR